MSTRAQIQIKGSEVMIYKHSDGYPSETLPTLIGTMQTFIKERGNEPDYALAQIMRAFARRDEKRRQEQLERHQNELAKWEEDEPEYESVKMWVDIYGKHRMTGWGLDTVRHGDIEFLYTVDLSKGVVIVETGYGEDMGQEKIIKLEEEIK